MDDRGWAMAACAVAGDLAAAMALRPVAGALTGKRQSGTSAAVAYASAASACLLAGAGDAIVSWQNALLLAAAAAALTRNGALLATVLLAAGSADWLPGAVLLAAPVALLCASRGGSSSSPSGSNAKSSSGSSGNQGMSGSRRSFFLRLAGYCLALVASSAALHLAAGLLPGRLSAQLRAVLGVPAWQLAVPAVPAVQLESDPLAWVGARISQQPRSHPAAVVLPAASLQPGLGLHWYLLAQAFPQFRAFFLYALHAAPAAVMLPLALRFPRRPELLLAAGALARCLLHPRPQPGMAALWVGLLPLSAPELAPLSGLPWMALGMAAALLLSGAAADLWLVAGGGNANFLYGMNLLWAGLQLLLLLRLVRSAARQEAAAPEAAGGDVAGRAGEAAARRR